jgi:GntR family transcriptional regulator/MocR family aminotransferase
MPRLLTLFKAGPAAGPPYRALAASLRQALARGQAAPGELLPSLRELSAQCGLHWHTVRAALQDLEAEGWLGAEPRRGYRVLARPAPEGPAPAALLPSGPGRARPTARPLPASSAGADAGPRPAHDFSWGHADLRDFPLTELKACFAASLRRLRPRDLGYGDPRGHAPWLAQLEAYLRRRRGLLGRSLLATQGSQEALHLAAQVLIRPGDTVAVEAPGYGGARMAFLAAGARLAPVPVDAEGLDVEALGRLLKRRRVRLLHLTPLHQYPTTVTLSPARRQALYALLRRHGLLALEDDYDHEVHYRGQALAPLAAQDPDGRILYTSSFSKVLLPGLRLGFLALPPAWAPAFVAARRLVSYQGDTVAQDALARWMATDGFERHLRRVRRRSLERLDGLEALLKGHQAAGLPWAWRRPDGGFGLWLGLGADSRPIAARARALGVGLLEESGFWNTKKPSHVRLGFARLDAREQAAGLERLAQAARA